MAAVWMRGALRVGLALVQCLPSTPLSLQRPCRAPRRHGASVETADCRAPRRKACAIFVCACLYGGWWCHSPADAGRMRVGGCVGDFYAALVRASSAPVSVAKSISAQESWIRAEEPALGLVRGQRAPGPPMAGFYADEPGHVRAPPPAVVIPGGCVPRSSTASAFHSFRRADEGGPL